MTLHLSLPAEDEVEDAVLAETCANCRHLLAYPPDRPRGPGEGRAIGKCGKPRLGTGWKPFAYADAWCSEFEAKA